MGWLEDMANGLSEGFDAFIDGITHFPDHWAIHIDSDQQRALKDAATSLPLIGPLIEVAFNHMEGAYSDENQNNRGEQGQGSTIQIENVLDLTPMQEMINQFLNEVSKAPENYGVDPQLLSEIRKETAKVTSNIYKTDQDYSEASRRLDVARSSLNDYISGVQKKAVQQEYDAALQDVKALEKDRAKLSSTLAENERKISTINDLALTPITEENESVVKKLSSDLSLSLQDTPTTKEETR